MKTPSPSVSWKDIEHAAAKWPGGNTPILRGRHLSLSPSLPKGLVGISKLVGSERQEQHLIYQAALENLKRRNPSITTLRTICRFLEYRAQSKTLNPSVDLNHIKTSLARITRQTRALTTAPPQNAPISIKTKPSHYHLERARLFCHVMLNCSPIRLESIEGWKPDHAIQAMQKFLREFTKSHPKVKTLTSPLLRKLETAERLWNEEEEFSNLLTDHLDQLAIGDQLIVGGGTHQHAVLYRFDRTSSHRYTFTIGNTGEGSFETANSNRIANLQFTKVSKRMICNRDFLRLLESARGEDIPTRTLLQRIEDLLKQDRLVAKGMATITHTKQRIGICAWKCVSTWVSEALPRDIALSFKWFITAKTQSFLDSLRRVASYSMSSEKHQKLLNHNQKVVNRRREKWLFEASPLS